MSQPKDSKGLILFKFFPENLFLFDIFYQSLFNGWEQWNQFKAQKFLTKRRNSIRKSTVNYDRTSWIDNKVNS